MARISKPELEIEYLYKKYTGDRLNSSAIYRAYYRNNDRKFIPFGWTVQGGTIPITFDDEEIANVTNKEIIDALSNL